MAVSRCWFCAPYEIHERPYNRSLKWVHHTISDAKKNMNWSFLFISSISNHPSLTKNNTVAHLPIHPGVSWDSSQGPTSSWESLKCSCRRRWKRKRGMRSASWNFTASTIQNLGITRFFGPTVPRGHFGKWILVLFFYTRFKRGSILASFSSNEMPNILFVTNHHLHCFK